jgi:drug/metabolite transporter (DMT)-like permease
MVGVPFRFETFNAVGRRPGGVSRFRDAALFVLLAAVWGSAFVAIKAGLDYVPPVLFAALRYDVASVVMLAYAWWAVDRWHPRTRADWWLVGVGGVLLIAAYHAFLFVGEQETTSAAAAVVVSLSPALTTGFARVFLPDERLAPAGVVGLLVGLAGVVVIARPDPANLLAPDVVGRGLVLLAAASFALGSVLTRRSRSDLPLEAMEAWSMLLGALVMHAVSAGIGESPGDVVVTAESVGALAYLSLVASGLGFLVYFDLLDRLGPIQINLVSYVAPVFAALAGYLWLDERVSVATGAGFLLVVVGFALVKRAAVAAELRNRLGGDPGP